MMPKNTSIAHATPMLSQYLPCAEVTRISHLLGWNGLRPSEKPCPHILTPGVLRNPVLIVGLLHLAEVTNDLGGVS